MSIAEEPWPEELPEDEFEVDPDFGSEEDYPEDVFGEPGGDIADIAGADHGADHGVVGWS